MLIFGTKRGSKSQKKRRKQLNNDTNIPEHAALDISPKRRLWSCLKEKLRRWSLKELIE